VSHSYPPQARASSRLQLARFSAATWNSHHIHVDPVAARAEGLPDVVVQSTLFPELAASVARTWFGDQARQITRIAWRNRRPVVADQILTWTLRDSRIDQATGELDLDLAAIAEDGAIAVEVEMTIRTPGLDRTAQFVPEGVSDERG
jgi:hydroxyacyl-ACP dehydratase HTD2-like protein with hotdog domain